MSIEQFEISIGSRLGTVPRRQLAKAKIYDAASEPSKPSKPSDPSDSNTSAGVNTVNGVPVQEVLIVHEPVVQEVIDAIVEEPPATNGIGDLYADQELNTVGEPEPDVLPSPGDEIKIALDSYSTDPTYDNTDAIIVSAPVVRQIEMVDDDLSD